MTYPFENMRKFHNYIKNLLIKKYAYGSSRLLDLACGKGGDIYKWISNRIKNVDGFDMNNESIQEAHRRYNQIINTNNLLNINYNFYVLDVGQNVINSNEAYSCVSCQFAMHYFFVNELNIENFMKNITKNLKKNGYFIATIFNGDKLTEKLHNSGGKIVYPNYELSLINNETVSVYIKDSVLHTTTNEPIVLYNKIIQTFSRYNLTLIESKSFYKFYNSWIKKTNCQLTPEEKSLSFLYKTFIFQKN